MVGIRFVIFSWILSLTAAEALAAPRTCFFPEDASWSYVDEARRLQGDAFVNMVINVIDWAHPYTFSRILGKFRSSKAILEQPSHRVSLTLIAQLSRLQQIAKQKILTAAQIQTIHTHILSALNSFGGNGLGNNTGLWVLSNRTPLGIVEARTKDLLNKEHDYLIFAYRDWGHQPLSRESDIIDLSMQVEFAGARKYAQEKFDLYIETVENAAGALNEEGYMLFATILAKTLIPELIYSDRHLLSSPQVLAILNSLRAHTANFYFMENSVTIGEGFTSFRSTFRDVFPKYLWRDSQTRDNVEAFLKDWEQEIIEKIFFIKSQYIRQMRPLTDTDVVALREKFRKKLVVP